MIRQVSRCARQLEREGTCYARQWAKLLRAGIAARQEDRDGAVALLREAVAVGEVHHLLQTTEAARARLGVLLGGPAGAELVTRAHEWMAGEGATRLERALEIVAPGFDDYD